MATVIDLFSGAGGLALGFAAAGCQILAAVDVDECASRTFADNFRVLQPDCPPLVLGGDEGDLEDLDLEQISPGVAPDLLVGGPPCQGFSRIGRAKIDSLYEEGFEGDPRNTLYRRFLDAAELWRPLAVVMENVPGMLSVGDRNVADEAAAELSALGYRVGYGLLNAVWYGVPQFRERLFFIGVRSDLGIEPGLPPATHHINLPPGYTRPLAAWTLPLPFIEHRELYVDLTAGDLPATTVGEALNDLPVLTDHLQEDARPTRGDFRKLIQYSKPPATSYDRLMRAWPSLPTRDVLDDHVIRRTPRDHETFRRMQPGDRYPEAIEIARERFEEALDERRRLGTAPVEGSPGYRELERRYIPPYPIEIFRDKWRKLIPDQPSWTATAHLSKDAYSHIHHDAYQARSISVREAARLQSFPDSFSFSGNMGDCYRQIGNAVPPLVAWAIGSKLLELLGRPFRRVPWETLAQQQNREITSPVDRPDPAKDPARWNSVG